MKKTFAFAIPAVLLTSVGSVMAAVPAEISTALGEMKTDGLVVAAAVLVAVIAIFAIKFLRKGL